MRGGKKERQWEKAQVAEAGCWASLASNLNSDEGRAWKEEFWEKHLEAMDWRLDERIRRYNRPIRVLDVGCGPSGVLLYLNKLSDDLIMTGLDLLMDHYLDISPRLRQMPIEWISLPFEDFKPGELFDVVFALNVIDHCREIDAFVRQLCKTVSPNGEVWVSVNCHTKIWQAALWRKFKLEELHPYHYTIEEYSAMFSKHFQIKSIHDVTRTLFNFENSLPESEDEHPTQKKWKSLFKPRTCMRRILHLGMPILPTLSDQSSVYRTMAFLLIPRSNE